MIPNLASYLDFANHQAHTMPADITGLCQNVIKYGFHGAFVNPIYVPLAKKLLADKAVVGTAIAFPLGQEVLDVKIAALQTALKNGADELDVVANLALLLGDTSGEKYLAELKSIVQTSRQVRQEAVVKFILEAGYLTPRQIKLGTQAILDSGADYVKICSGWGPRGASLDDLELVKEVVGGKIKIKVSGGIDTYPEAIAFIEAGVTRIGTSHAVKIMQEATNTPTDP